MVQGCVKYFDNESLKCHPTNHQIGLYQIMTNLQKCTRRDIPPFLIFKGNPKSKFSIREILAYFGHIVPHQQSLGTLSTDKLSED